MAELNNCGICKIKKGLYNCPKCGVLYCGLNCYRTPQHQRCSEKFYQDCVESELRSSSPVSQETKVKTLAMLQRLHLENNREDDEEESLDSDDDEDIAVRLSNVDLDDSDAVWSKLNAQERREFQTLINNGEIERFVPEFKPWWQNIQIHLIQDLDDEKSSSLNRNLPQLVAVPEFNVKIVSDTLKFSLLNILYAYAYALKYFHGVDGDNINDFGDMVMNLSDVLRVNQNFTSCSLALESAATNVNVNNVGVTKEMTKETKKDVYEIVKKSLISHALSDLITQFRRIIKHVKEKDIKKKIKLAEKKIEFYLSWTSSPIFNPKIYEV